MNSRKLISDLDIIQIMSKKAPNYINSKLPGFGLSIFAKMTKLAQENKAINLSQGFPDFNCSDELIELVNKYQKKGFNQYAPMPGVFELRQKISKKIKKLYSKKYNFESEITITSGATQALYTAISCSIKKDDEVIIPEPAYDSYSPVVILNGGNPVYVPLNKNDFTLDWNKIKDAITDKTRMIIINSPHNPTGSIITHSDIKILEEITRDTKILILSDEVYEHIIFDGQKHISISESEELSAKAFVISSFGKTYHTTGWKIGYCAAPEHLTEEFRKIHQFIVFAVNTPIQLAYAEYMNEEKHYQNLSPFYQRKRDILIDSLTKSRFKFSPTKGTYFQLLDYSNISDKNDMEFAIYLAKEKGVAVIPISPFCTIDKEKKIIRVCFAKNDEVLMKASEILNNI
ncbi:MAG TPA: methionine aminotransferase [Ignavibacteriaceae bacterium]|nr:methionine aminotransferase [Ignavibacteriaceae bacterium]